MHERPLLVTLSPPCQGMSTAGAGKIMTVKKTTDQNMMKETFMIPD